MAISIRIPPELLTLITKATGQAGKTKTAFIIKAINKKLDRMENRERDIRNLAGWLSRAEASELEAAVEVFELMPNDEASSRQTTFP